MRVFLAGIALALVAAFIFFTLRQERPAESSGEVEWSASESQRREAVRRFWHLYKRATELRLRQDWDGAAAAYGEALKLDAEHEDALYYLGNVLFEGGRHDGAISAWEDLVRVNVLSSRAHAQLGAVYSCGAADAPFDLERAEREFKRALEINKEESGPVLKLGEIALLRGAEDRALEYLTAGSRSNFKSVAARYLIGFIQWRSGEERAALESLQRAVELSRGGAVGSSASNEGDTRGPGGQPLLAARTRRKSLLEPHWQALGEWDEEGATEVRMAEEYGRLQTRLQEWRKGLVASD